ncbi:MAG: shikimate dehydrogenase [bacterium]
MGLHLSRAGVLARPVAHSLSPLLHRAAYAALGLTGWTYEPIDCGAEELAGLVRASPPDWVGYSISRPGKEAALALADEVGERAGAAGAANTLVRRADGGWRADNTDVAGLAVALGEGLDVGRLPQREVVILGAGATARSAVVALAYLGVTAVTVAVRDASRTADLIATAEPLGIAVSSVSVADPGGFDPGAVVISTLPPTAADALSVRTWSTDTVVLDVVYAPWPTELAAAVRAAGGMAIGGARLLLHQAAEQVWLMTGRPAPLAAMAAALDTAVRP